MRVLTIDADGTVTLGDVPAIDYEFIRGVVRNWIEAVQLRADVTMYVDEEHKLNHETVKNIAATRLARHYGAIFADDWIGGPVCVVGFDAREGDSVELPQDFAEEAVRVCTTDDLAPVRVAPTFMESVAEDVFAGVPVIAVVPPSPEPDPRT